MSEDSRPVWTARFYRGGSIDTERFDSLREAAAYLEYGTDDCSLSVDAILGPDGQVLYNLGYSDGQIGIEELRERLDAEAARADSPDSMT